MRAEVDDALGCDEQATAAASTTTATLARM
jgi:hypothetical protein